MVQFAMLSTGVPLEHGELGPALMTEGQQTAVEFGLRYSLQEGLTSGSSCAREGATRATVVSTMAGKCMTVR
jgi:hypothetical protein